MFLFAGRKGWRNGCIQILGGCTPGGGIVIFVPKTPNGSRKTLHVSLTRKFLIGFAVSFSARKMWMFRLDMFGADFVSDVHCHVFVSDVLKSS